MLLNDVLAGDHLTLLRLEQTVNGGSPSGFTTKHTTSASTAPGRPALIGFPLPMLALSDPDAMTDFGEAPDFAGKSHFFIHPDMFAVQSIGRFAHELIVFPTASARTVRTAGSRGWFIKLGYRGIIGRFPRDLGRMQAASSVEVSRILSQTLASGACEVPVHIFPEPFARVVHEMHNDGSTYEWGYVLRDGSVFPAVSPDDRLVPAFSLFAKDKCRPADPSLLAQIVNANGSANPTEYVVNKLLVPLVRTYFEVLTRSGLQLEAHAQNVLFVLDSLGNPIGVVLRDAESIDKDLDLIHELGLAVRVDTLDWKCLCRAQDHYQAMHSFMYDHKLGEYLLDPLIKAAHRDCGVSRQKAYEAIKSCSSEYIRRLPEDFFPKGQWFNYRKEMRDRTKKREFIAHDDLRFRPS